MLASLLAGIGGAASSGLNAYLPLLMLALADRASGSINLASPYDMLSSTWGIIVLLCLLPVELLADKIPGLDHASDLVHSAIRPAAAALMMMALTDERGHVNPVVALILGLLIGVLVHGVKATTRPGITIATSGTGNPFVSMMEDVVVVITVIVSLFAPLWLLLWLPVAAWGLWMVWARFRSGNSLFGRLGQHLSGTTPGQ